MNFHSATADGYYFLHGANRTTSRYGLSLADWVELTHGGSDDLNGIVIGTRTDIPVVIGANNNEIARFTDTGVGIGTTSPTEALEVNGSILATSGDVSGQLSVLSNNPDYPRAGFKINSDGNAANYGFSIRNDSATDSSTFLEIVNAADYSASTARALMTQSPTAFTIRCAKDNGNVAGTAMVFSTKGNQDAAITIPSDSTNVNFGGNVGIGTTAPDELLHLEATAVSEREVLMKATVSDAGNDQLGIANGTLTNNNFAPSFYGYKDSTYGSGYIYSLNFRGLVPNAQDTTQTNRFGIVHFEASKTNNAADPNNGTLAALTNRKLFTFGNRTKNVLQIDADDTVTVADDANLRWSGYTTPGNNTAFNPAIGINVDRDNISGLDFRNQSTTGQVRFMARNDQDSYIVINQPASNANSTWFGIPAGNGSYLFTSSPNDTDKKLGIGTLNAGDVVIGANNIAAMNIKASTRNVEILNTLDFGERESNDTLILAKTNDHDISLIRASATSGVVGVDLKYLGSGSGDENIFEIATDGGGSLKIDNSGDVGINVAPTDGVDLTVGSLKLGSIADVEAEINAKAPTASPTLTGTTAVEKICLTANSFIVETANFTLTSAHCGATVLLQNTGAITITVPQLTAGHTTTFIAETANTVNFASGTGLLGLQFL